MPPSYSSNFNLNQRLSYLESISGNPVPTTSNLADVLLNGNNAGATDIDMNNQDILQVNNIDLVTINGSVYPPAVSTLADVLLAGNNAGATDIDMNNNIIDNVNSIKVIAPVADQKNTITNSGMEIIRISNQNPYMSLKETDLRFYNEPTNQLVSEYGKTLMEITNTAGTSAVTVDNSSITVRNPNGNDYSQLDINSLDFADATGAVVNTVTQTGMAITGAGTISATGGLTIPSAVDFTNATAPTCLAIPILSEDLCNKNYVDSQAALTAYQLYFNYSIPYTVPGGATYTELSPLQIPTPATVAWTTNSTAPVLLGSFFNSLVGLNIPASIPAGVWTLLVYANLTSIAGQGREGFFYELYGTTALGAETLIYGSPTSLLLNTVSPLVGSVSVQGTVPLTSLTGYTGLGIRLYIQSNNATVTTGSVFYQTATAYSSILTSFAVVQAPNLLGLNNVWTGTNTFNSTLTGNLTGTTTNLAGGLGGQIPYQSAVNTTALLTNGTASQVLTSAGTTLPPTWTTLPTTIATATNLAGGIASQIPYQSSAGVTAFIANGTVGQVLTSAGTAVPAWSTPSATTLANVLLAGNNAGATDINMNSQSITSALSISSTTFTGALTGNASTATNLTGGLGGQIPYQSAVNTTALLANGTAGQFLTSAGTTLAPTWTTGGSSTTINITDTNTNATYYPTFVDSAGSGKILQADIGTTPFSINPNTSDLRFGTSLKLDATNLNVAVGNNAGLTTQGANSVAIGPSSGTTTQGSSAVAIGTLAGNASQGASSVAVGNSAGQTNQVSGAIAIGFTSGQTSQSGSAVAIGNTAGKTSQGSSAVAIGLSAGTTSQGASSIAIGSNAGNANQGANAIAIGNNAGVTSQTAGSICLNASGVVLNPSQVGCFINPIRNLTQTTATGYDTTTKEITYYTAPVTITSSVVKTVGVNTDTIVVPGYLSSNYSGSDSVNFGEGAGKATSAGTQPVFSVAIGNLAGNTQQRNSVAVGALAQQTGASQYCTALGQGAGNLNQGAGAGAGFCLAVGGSAGGSNQGQYATAVGATSGNTSQGAGAVAVGYISGQTSQGIGSVAIGRNAGNATQATQAIAIGLNAGQTSQGTNTVAVGLNAGLFSQGAQAIAIGINAGRGTSGLDKQGTNSIAIGNTAGIATQGASCVAIGTSAGNANQLDNAVAVGSGAGLTSQGASAVALGNVAGNISQGGNAVAIGIQAGQTSQGASSIAIGALAGATTQGGSAVAIGISAGTTTQGASAVAIGSNAGSANQGANAIAIGNNAGVTSQTAGSICLNATGVVLNPSVAGLHINPIRNDTTKQNQVQYNTTSKEVSYVAQVVSPVTTGGLDLTGNAALLSGTASGSSGQHLVVVINGVTYKIDLKNV